MKELKKLSLDAVEEARKLRDDGNLNAAVAKYQEALRYDPGPAVHKELGDLLVELKRYEEARAQYKLALMKNPSMTEVEEAMDRLDARIQLAESSSKPGVDRGPAESAEQIASTGRTNHPEIARDSEEYYDEDLAFAEMEQIEPPKPSPFETSESQARIGTEGFGELPSGEDTQRGPVNRLARAVPTPRRSLGGGRGLLPPVGRKPSILSSRSSGPEEVLEARTRTTSSPLLVAEADTSRTPLAPVPGGHPGERTLSVGRRFPAVVRENIPPKPRRNQPPPGFDLVSSEPATGEEAGGEEPDSGKSRRGFFKDLIDTDEDVSYPEPPAPQSSQDLLPPLHPEREQLDLTKWGFDRFKGKRKPKLDLEICKKRYYEEHDLEGAVRCFADKRIDFPTNALLYYELGRIYEDAGSPERARENFELALRYDPDNRDYKHALAIADVESARQLRKSGDLREARSILLTTIDDFPEMVEAHRELAKVYIQEAQSKQAAIDRGEPATDELIEHIRQSWRQAEELYRKVVDLSPDNPNDWYNLGVAIQEQYDDSKTNTAIRAYEKAIDLKPDFAKAHRNLAILYESQSVPKALEHYERALAIARNEPEGEGVQMVTDCLRDIGELYWRIGETEKAAEYLTEYLQYVPSDAEIEDILDQITSVPPEGE